MITKEEELKLEGQRVADLLNNISGLQQQAIEENSHFYVANILGKCYETIKTLHIINMETIRENELLRDHKRWEIAAKAMQEYLHMMDASEFCLIPKAAFTLADNMVNYGKQNSETKCTSDGTGNTHSEDSNN